MDASACNYDVDAVIDNGSCEYADVTCWDDSIVCDASDCPADPNACTAEVCLSIENVDTDAGTLDIYMENSVGVTGFQFELFGITLSGASGGIAGEVMDMVQANSGCLLYTSDAADE